MSMIMLILMVTCGLDADGTTEKQIQALVEKLASKNSPPARNAEFSQRLDRPKDWKDRHEQAVRDARKQLLDFGKTAFPVLLDNLGDERYSLTESYSIEVNHTVGQVCGIIIKDNVDRAGIRYKSRIGADGRNHQPPDFISQKYQGDLKRWWRDNRAKSLREMRVDVLKWVIAEEKRIGTSPMESKWHERYVAELAEKLKDMEAGE